MIGLAVVILLAAGGGETDRSCSPAAEPTGPTTSVDDPAGGAIYRAVGDDERAAGNVAAARIAYREALRRNPSDDLARAALEALCADPAPSNRGSAEVAAPERDAFAEGVSRMKRGDRAGAIASFEAARAAEPDPAATLLEGICEYERGNDEAAKRLFEEARVSARGSGVALLFLGLIALHEDQEPRAASLFEAAGSSDPRIVATVAGLARLVHRDGRVVVSAMAESGYDSNVVLAPDGTPITSEVGDGYSAGILGLFVRPLGVSGPYGRVMAQYRKQFEITSYDLGDVGGAIGLRAGRGASMLAAEYGYDFVSLGATPYLSAHRLLGTGRLSRGRLSVAGTYALRFESFLTGTTAPYSGLLHDGQAEVDWRQRPAVVFGLGYHVGRDTTDDPSFRYLEHGPIAVLRLALGERTRLVTEAQLTLRAYDLVTPAAFGVDRDDRYFDGALAGERDLGDRWTLRITGTARRALSTVPSLQYTKLTAALGLVYTAGVL